MNFGPFWPQLFPEAWNPAYQERLRTAEVERHHQIAKEAAKGSHHKKKRKNLGKIP